MAKRTVEDEPDRTIPEDTIVRGKLVQLEDKPIKWKDKQTGEDREATITEWWWEIQSPEDYENRKVKGSCNAKVTNHPSNRWRLWAEALLGRELDANMTLDDDDLIGLVADLTVSHRPSKDGERVFEEVDEVIPVSADNNIPF